MGKGRTSWEGFYRGFHIQKAGSGWEVRTGAGRVLHPHRDFQALYTERDKRDRVYMKLLATRKTRTAARAFADATISRERRR